MHTDLHSFTYDKRTFGVVQFIVSRMGGVSVNIKPNRHIP